MILRKLNFKGTGTNKFREGRSGVVQRRKKVILETEPETNELRERNMMVLEKRNMRLWNTFVFQLFVSVNPKILIFKEAILNSW